MILPIFVRQWCWLERNEHKSVKMNTNLGAPELIADGTPTRYFLKKQLNHIVENLRPKKSKTVMERIKSKIPAFRELGWLQTIGIRPLSFFTILIPTMKQCGERYIHAVCVCIFHKTVSWWNNSCIICNEFVRTRSAYNLMADDMKTWYFALKTIESHCRKSLAREIKTSHAAR